MIRILGISGSPRKGGNSDTLLQTILEGAAEVAQGLECEALHLRDYHVHPCIACERCRKDKACTGVLDGMQLVYPKIEAAAGLVLVSPTYHYNVSGQMKVFIDRLYQYYDFTDELPRGYTSRLGGQGRKAVVAAVCEQENESDMGRTIEMLRRPVEPLGYEVLGELPVLRHFAKGAVKQDTQALDAARRLGQKLGKELTGAVA